MFIDFNQVLGLFGCFFFGDSAGMSWLPFLGPSVLRSFTTSGRATDPRFGFTVNGCAGAAALFAPKIVIAALA